MIVGCMQRQRKENRATLAVPAGENETEEMESISG